MKPRSFKRQRLPEALIEAWFEAVRAAAKPSKKLANLKDDKDAVLEHIWSHDGDDVVQLWETFTTERASLPRYLQNPQRQRLAYLLGFHLPNIARMNFLISAASERTDLNPKKLPFHIHDIGAGTGAATIATLDIWGKYVEQCDLYDHQGLFLESAAAQIKAVFNLDVKSAPQSLFHMLPKLKLSPGRMNIILMNYVWNEVANNAGLVKRLLQTLQRAAQQDAPALFFLGEGANQNQARATMEMRNDIVEAGWVPIFPCPHGGLCPLLERTRDWCYSEGRWQPPLQMQAIDRALGIDRSSFAMSGYVFANPASQIKPASPPAVVVGRPKEQRSKSPQFRYLLCGKDGEMTKSEKAYPVRPPFKMRGQSYV